MLIVTVVPASFLSLYYHTYMLCSTALLVRSSRWPVRTLYWRGSPVSQQLLNRVTQAALPYYPGKHNDYTTLID